MFDDFLRFINEQQLYRKGEKILLALSGGVDSMVLLDLLLNARLPLEAAHCNFQLRGEESDEDERFIKEITDQHGIICHIKSFRTSEFAREKGISIQMAARELRYSWFEELCDAEGYDRIAMAHHLDDSIETVIFNLIKGTGLRGLTGIASKAGRVIRPLLFATKKEILEYAEQNRIVYREDSSNMETKYHRNYIRKSIIPHFEKINPGFKNRFLQSITRLADTREVWDKMICQMGDKFIKQIGNDIYIEKSGFGNVTVLHELICDYGFNYEQSKQIFSGLNSETGKIFYSDDHVLNIDRDHLIVSPIDNLKGISLDWESSETSLDVPGGVMQKEKVEAYEGRGNDDANQEFFDLSKLSFPLKVRTWEDGDWFIPLGMSGKKKVSDFMIDNKIPVNLKKRILVLLSGKSIVWIIGYRIDERFKITPETSDVLKISYRPFYDQSV